MNDTNINSKTEQLLTLYQEGQRNFKGFNLASATLAQARLPLIVLEGANLEKINLEKANLMGANFSRANLKNANLKSANFMGADLVKVELENANLTKALLSGANLSASNLQDCDLSGASFVGADLTATDLRGANLKGANFKGANLKGANLLETNLDSAIFNHDDLKNAIIPDNFREKIAYLPHQNPPQDHAPKITANFGLYRPDDPSKSLTIYESDNIQTDPLDSEISDRQESGENNLKKEELITSFPQEKIVDSEEIDESYLSEVNEESSASQISLDPVFFDLVDEESSQESNREDRAIIFEQELGDLDEFIDDEFILEDDQDEELLLEDDEEINDQDDRMDNDGDNDHSLANILSAYEWFEEDEAIEEIEEIEASEVEITDAFVEIHNEEETTSSDSQNIKEENKDYQLLIPQEEKLVVKENKPEEIVVNFLKVEDHWLQTPQNDDSLLEQQLVNDEHDDHETLLSELSEISQDNGNQELGSILDNVLDDEWLNPSEEMDLAQEISDLWLDHHQDNPPKESLENSELMLAESVSIGETNDEIDLLDRDTIPEANSPDQIDEIVLQIKSIRDDNDLGNIIGEILNEDIDQWFNDSQALSDDSNEGNLEELELVDEVPILTEESHAFTVQNEQEQQLLENIISGKNPDGQNLNEKETFILEDLSPFSPLNPEENELTFAEEKETKPTLLEESSSAFREINLEENELTFTEEKETKPTLLEENSSAFREINPEENELTFTEEKETKPTLLEENLSPFRDNLELPEDDLLLPENDSQEDLFLPTTSELAGVWQEEEEVPEAIEDAEEATYILLDSNELTFGEEKETKPTLLEENSSAFREINPEENGLTFTEEKETKPTLLEENLSPFRDNLELPEDDLLLPENDSQEDFFLPTTSELAGVWQEEEEEALEAIEDAGEDTYILVDSMEFDSAENLEEDNVALIAREVDEKIKEEELAPISEEKITETNQQNEILIKERQERQKKAKAEYIQKLNNPVIESIKSVLNYRVQYNFKKQVLEVYHSQCVITKCNIFPLLEVVMIDPMAQEKHDHPSNGLVLRRDLSVLFDLSLLAIHPQNLTVLVSPTIHNEEYQALNGQKIILPNNESIHPAPQFLSTHLKNCSWYKLKVDSSTIVPQSSAISASNQPKNIKEQEQKRSNQITKYLLTKTDQPRWLTLGLTGIAVCSLVGLFVLNNITKNKTNPVVSSNNQSLKTVALKLGDLTYENYGLRGDDNIYIPLSFLKHLGIDTNKIKPENNQVNFEFSQPLKMEFIDLKIKEKTYPKEGLIIARSSESHIPMALIKNLAIEDSEIPPDQIIVYQDVKFVKTAQLKKMGVKIGWDAQTRVLSLNK